MYLDLQLNIYITKMYGTMNIKFDKLELVSKPRSYSAERMKVQAASCSSC
jgi:hypothetical protein